MNSLYKESPFTPTYAQFPPMKDLVRVETRVEQQFYMHSRLMDVEQDDFIVYGEHEYRDVQKMIVNIPNEIVNILFFL